MADLRLGPHPPDGVTRDLRERPAAVDLLDDGACGRWSRRVIERRAHWTRRHPLAPFHTLGAAAYLDATAGCVAYDAAAARTNDLLADDFGGLYRSVVEGLAEHLAAPVLLTARFALPGFHIYEPFAAFAADVASLHWDRQHALLAWDDGPVPEDGDVLSLTLPLSLPEGGADLQVWPQHRHGRGEAACRLALADPGVPEVCAYRPGVMQVHDGQSLHRASLMPRRRFGDGGAGDDLRITLQAHLAWRGGVWELYW